METKIKPEKGSEFYCEKCDYNTSCNTKYLKHISTNKHKLAYLETQGNGNSVKFVCEACSYYTNKISNYKTHLSSEKHKNNIVHGDIKPENMMFNASDNNTLVLIDWGLSYIADSDRKNVPDALSALSVQPMHPFSSFLFKKNVIEKYDVFLKDLKTFLW